MKSDEKVVCGGLCFGTGRLPGVDGTLYILVDSSLVPIDV